MSDETVLTDTQEAILDATMSCIVRDGIDGASLRSVARQADVSLGLLSYHFQDKRSLIVAAFRLATDRLFETSLDSLDGLDDAEDRVRAFVRGAFHGKFLEHDYLALRLALWAISRTDPHIEAVEKRLYVRYAKQIAALIGEARPALSAEQAGQRATDIIVIQNGLWLNWARHSNLTDLRRGLARCDEIALGPSTPADGMCLAHPVMLSIARLRSPPTEWLPMSTASEIDRRADRGRSDAVAATGGSRAGQGLRLDLPPC